MAPENFYFGGGAAGTTMHPAVLAYTLFVAVLMLLLPRQHLFAPVAMATFLTPAGSQVYAAGFHFFAIRIVILAFCSRLLLVRLMGRGVLLSGATSPADTTFLAWAICRGMAVILLHKDGGAVVNQIAFWLDAWGTYFVFRYSLRDYSDVLRALKVLAAIIGVLAVFMVYEHRTGLNLCNYYSTSTIVPSVREEGGGIRAQASFATSISAGGFGATLLPLFFWLWKRGKARVLGLVGLVASILVTLSSESATPLSACLGGILALSLWPMRKHMRKLRRGLAIAVACLALVMKAPVWYIIARVDFIGGHGWDRAFLLDMFSQHISSWWLVGTVDNASWGVTTWDLCNQFVAEAGSGGLATLVLFIAILYHAFRTIGLARNRASGKRRQELLYWCMGCSLFAHIMMFQGLSYYDQIQTWWFAFLAMVPAAAASMLMPARAGWPTSGGGSAIETGETEISVGLPQHAETAWG